MRRLRLVLFCLLTLLSVGASAGTYTLVDGSTIIGDPVSEKDDGVVFLAADGTASQRINWEKLTQESIRKLYAQAKSPQDKELIQPLLEENAQEKAARREIVVRPVEFPYRPAAHLGIFAIFASPLGWLVLLVLYGANLFAAYEVAIYRRQPVATVCGFAAIPFFGVISPIAYIAMPTQRPVVEQSEIEEQMSHTRFRATAPPAAVTAPPPEEAPVPMAQTSLTGAQIVAGPDPVPAASALPEPIVFRRGDFLFNRRFFETKLTGFFRVVPSEADKDMVVRITAARGDFTGKRIVRITPTELYLQVFHDNASAEEMIPFGEITEVQIRHKDAT